MPSTNLRFRLIGEDDASAAFLRVAAASKLTEDAMNNLGSSTLGLTKLIGGAGLIPVAAGATAAVAELGTALGAAAGAGSVFGLSVGGFLKQMVAQRTTIAATQKALDGATKGTTTYKTELQKLHKEQAAFNQQFGVAAKGYDNMHAAFSSFLKDTGPVTKGDLAKGFNLIADVLPKLVPVSNAAGKAVGTLLDQLKNWVDGPEFKAFLNFLQTSGPKDIKAFGHAIGYTVEGLGKIFANFVGPGDHAAHTVAQLAKAFDQWAGSASTSKGIQHFLQYVSQNGPAITSTLKALATAAPKIASALGRIGSADLNVLSKFLTLVAKMPQKDFNIVADGLFAIAAGAKAVTIATSIGTLGKGALVLLGLMKAKGAGGGGIAGAAGTALGGKGVVPVYVTNKGFGGPGGGMGGEPGAGGDAGFLGKLGKYFGYGAGGTGAAGTSGGVALAGSALGAAVLTAYIGYIQRNIYPYTKRGATDPGVARGGVAAAKAFGTYQAPQGTPNIPGGAYSARGGQAALDYYKKLSDGIKTVSTRFDAMSAKAAQASRNVDLIGPAADHALGGAGKQATSLSGKIAAIKAGPASAAMDLIGQSAQRNFSKASGGADTLKNHINAIPGNKSVNVSLPGASAAASELDHINNSIRTIPSFKTSTITIVTRHIGGQVFATGGHTVGGSGGSGADGFVHSGSGMGASRGSGRNFGPGFIGAAGATALAGLVHGIRSRSIGLQRVQSALSSGITAARSRYQAAVQSRNSYASGFQNFASSVFGASFGQDANGNPIAPTFSSILAMQKQQQQQAALVKRDVAKLTRMHLSPALLKQLQAAGAAGLPTLEALATATPAQIALLNKSNASTMGDLHSAGMTAGNAIYGKMIKGDKQQLDRLRSIDESLKELVHGDKGDIIIKLEGKTLVESIRKHQRKKGVPPTKQVN